MSYRAMVVYRKEYFSKLVKFGFPAILEMLVTNLGVLLMGMFVGRNDVNDIYASYSLAYNVFSSIYYMFNGLFVGITVVLVRHTSREHDNHNGVASAFMSVITVMSVAISVLIAVFAREVVGLFYSSAEAHVFDGAVVLHRYFCIVLCIQIISLAFNACWRGVGNFKTPTVAMVLMSLLTVVFGAVFIAYLKLGVLGIALSLVLSRIIPLLYQLIVFLRGKSGIGLSVFKKPEFKETRDSFIIGSMAFLEQFSIQIAYLILQSIIVRVGTSALTGYQSANSIINFIYMISGGLTVALVTACGEYYAQRKLRKTKGCAWFFTLFTYVTAGSAGLVCALIPGKMMSLFLKPGEAHEIGTKILPMLAATLLITTLFQVMPGLFKAIGNTRITFIIAVTGSLCVRIPFAYLFIIVLEWGYLGIVASLSIDYLYRFLFYLIKTYRLFRNTKHIHAV